jgi:hypothetical protein
MLIDCRDNLNDLNTLLVDLTNDQYTLEHSELSSATIGQHTRHIIELYQGLLRDYECGSVNYDNRKRDIFLETDTDFAVEAIEEIISQIDKSNKELKVHYQFNSGSLYEIDSTYYRELLYNLEHSIHHQALIKVAIQKWPEIRISDSFGIAPATIRYRNQLID